MIYDNLSCCTTDIAICIPTNKLMKVIMKNSSIKVIYGHSMPTPNIPLVDTNDITIVENPAMRKSD